MYPYDQFHIRCQTHPEIPPPFAHCYEISGKLDRSALNLSFNLVYTDRGGLSEEEIEEEGFSLNDDFSWKGTVHQVWKQQLDYLFKSSGWSAAPDSKQDYEIEITVVAGDRRETAYASGKSVRKWTYLIQEVKQAIFESEHIEAPLAIEYLDIYQGETRHVIINGYFADRTFSFQVNSRPRELGGWETLQELIRLIFLNTELEPELGIHKRPFKDGKYLLLPDTGWVRFGEGIREAQPGNKVLDKLTQAFERLIRGN